MGEAMSVRAGGDRRRDNPGAPAAGAPSPDLDRLLRDAQAGDQHAWTALVNLYARRLFALAKSRLRNEDTAEELVQSVFATLAQSLAAGTYDDRGKFEAWLFRVAMNRIRDEIRRRKRSAARFGNSAGASGNAIEAGPAALDHVAAPGGDADQSAGLSEAEQSRASLDALRAALEHLPDRDREIIELRHHGGLSFNQIADLLSEPVGTLLARHHRALRKLRKHIEAAGTDPAGTPTEDRNP